MYRQLKLWLAMPYYNWLSRRLQQESRLRAEAEERLAKAREAGTDVTFLTERFRFGMSPQQVLATLERKGL